MLQIIFLLTFKVNNSICSLQRVSQIQNWSRTHLDLWSTSFVRWQGVAWPWPTSGGGVKSGADLVQSHFLLRDKWLGSFCVWRGNMISYSLLPIPCIETRCDNYFTKIVYFSEVIIYSYGRITNYKKQLNN